MSEAVSGVTRRTVLKGVEGDATTGAVPGFRLVFLPDIHLKKGKGSREGFETALEAMGRLDPSPDFVVTGGDLVHDARSLDKADAQEMIELFQDIWKRHVAVPAYHSLGNHDVAGLTNDSFPRGDLEFGLELFRRALEMPGLYYSFDHDGWHFVVLNNFRVDGENFIAEYDEEQLEFLRRDLTAANGRPTMIFAHYPAVSAIEFFDGNAEPQEGAWSLGFDRATRNPQALVDIISDANVKAVFSGHIHRLDRIEAKGITFICAGSVSGSKWRGPEVDTPAGITVVDCSSDGKFFAQYLEYEAARLETKADDVV